jgi:cytochrome c553
MRRGLRLAGGVATLLAAFATLLAAFAAGHAQDAPADLGGPAGDPLAGRKVARMCAVCHGINGLSKQPDAPNLAGQDAGYIQRQLAAFKAGERHNEIMNAMAKTLGDQQMRDVAAYFAAIKVQVTDVPGP